VLWYWWPSATPVIVLITAAALVAAAIAIQKNPFVRAGLCLSGAVTLLLAYYAYAGIDNINDPYMGYFYWSVPIFVLTSLALGLADRLPPPPVLQRLAAVAAVVAAVLVLAVVPGFRTGAGDHDPSVPDTLRALNSYAAGRPLVIEIADPYLGPEVTGLLYWARRDGFRACLRDRKWSFIATTEFICTPAEVADGVVVSRWQAAEGSPPREGEIARTGVSAFISG
jgi:hypothetical protein